LSSKLLTKIVPEFSRLSDLLLIINILCPHPDSVIAI
jgi:hypothetical protein